MLAGIRNNPAGCGLAAITRHMYDNSYYSLQPLYNGQKEKRERERERERKGRTQGVIFQRCTRERTFAGRKGNQHRLKFPREDSLESSEDEEDPFSPRCDEEREKERRDRNQAAPKGRGRRRGRGRGRGSESNFTLRDPLAPTVLLLYCPLLLSTW